MAYPIGKNEVYCYAQVVDPEKKYYSSQDYHEILKKIFHSYGGIAKILFEQLPASTNIIPGRMTSLKAVKFQQGKIAFIGDAAHGCTTMLQQGAASAFEDAITLYELLKQFSFPAAFEHYERFREPQVTWLRDASDIPMKKIITMTSELLEERNQQIRAQGPFNVIGWRQLLSKNFLNELNSYISKVTAKKICEF